MSFIAGPEIFTVNNWEPKPDRRLRCQADPTGEFDPNSLYNNIFCDKRAEPCEGNARNHAGR